MSRRVQLALLPLPLPSTHNTPPLFLRPPPRPLPGLLNHNTTHPAQPGCQNGHRLLRQRMENPRRRIEEGRGQEEEGKAADGGRVESREARAERQSFASFVLDWHLRRGYKTALLEVGEVVPDMLCEFLADWKEAELLWVFQARVFFFFFLVQHNQIHLYP